MTLTSRYTVFTVIAAVAVFLVTMTAVHANPSLFTSTQTATATTSIAYITPGLATTTLSYDADVGGDAFAARSASLLIMFTGSSTVSTLNTDIQYSQDGINWFNPGMGTDIAAGISSTTPSIANPLVVTLAYSSTTPDRGGITGNNVAASSTNRILNINMPTRYVRALFYIPPGSPSGAVWAQFVAQKENR